MEKGRPLRCQPAGVEESPGRSRLTFCFRLRHSPQDVVVLSAREAREFCREPSGMVFFSSSPDTYCGLARLLGMKLAVTLPRPDLAIGLRYKRTHGRSLMLRVV